MIAAGQIADAVIAAAMSAIEGAFPVSDTQAPPSPGVVYVVLEWPPGSDRSGSLGAPEAHTAIVVRVRGVARSATPAVARQAAQDAAHRVAAALLDRTAPIAGDGWVVTSRRHISDAGCDLVGDLANVVIDIELGAVPA